MQCIRRTSEGVASVALLVIALLRFQSKKSPGFRVPAKGTAPRAAVVRFATIFVAFMTPRVSTSIRERQATRTADYHSCVFWPQAAAS